jgi:hypothetical protein
MALYSLNGKYPQALPERIRLSNGQTRSDSSTFTAEEIADAGYVAVVKPSYDRTTHTLDWDGTDFTLRLYNDAEIAAEWVGIRASRDRILNQIDTMYGVTVDVDTYKSAETTAELSDDQKATKQALRDITNQDNPFDISWPIFEDNV